MFIYQPGVAGSLTAVDTRLSRGSTVRVGIAAQSYPFVAPTGVVDFQLRLPGEQQVVSFVSTYGPYETYNGELDAQIPLVKDKLGAVVGIGSTMMGAGVDRMVLSGGALLHWRLSDNFELIPFYNYLMQDDWDNFAYITTAGPYTPPKVKRRFHAWQDWIQWNHRDSLAGAIGQLTMGDWVLRAGLFHSHSWRLQRGDYLLQNMTREGLADAYAIIDLLQDNNALSGEARLMRAFSEGPRRHTFQFSARGYDSHREYGGGVPTYLGKITWGDTYQFPIPPLQFTALGKDDGQQGALGVNYAGAWANVGEASFSLQRTFYKRTLSPPAGGQTTTRDRPWLYNGTVAAYVTRALSLYASYARGLEDAPQAPPNAANNGAAVPASLTEQVDAGFRYVITPRLRFVAGVFELTKPFLDRNALNIYTSVGTVRNRGIELSLSGQVADGLTVVAAAIFLQARLGSCRRCRHHRADAYGHNAAPAPAQRAVYAADLAQDYLRGRHAAPRRAARQSPGHLQESVQHHVRSWRARYVLGLRPAGDAAPAGAERPQHLFLQYVRRRLGTVYPGRQRLPLSRALLGGCPLAKTTPTLILPLSGGGNVYTSDG